MKDIIITNKRIKIELKTMLICFLISFVANIGAVIYYKSPALEILTSLIYVLIFSGFIYLVWSFFRGMISLILKLKK